MGLAAGAAAIGSGIAGIASTVGPIASAIAPFAGPLASGIIGSNAGNGAAGAVNSAANQANATQLQMYNQTRSDLSPFMTTGSSAVSQLAQLFGIGGANGGVPNTAAMMTALQNTPGYQFGLNQGVQALDRSAASQGLLLSGAQLKGAQEFGTNYATQQAWQPYVQMLSGLASLGENAGAMVGNNGLQTGQGIAQTTASAGAVNAANQVSQGNIWNSALSQIGAQAQNWWPGASGGGSGTTMTMANAPSSVSDAFAGLW